MGISNEVSDLKILVSGLLNRLELLEQTIVGLRSEIVTLESKNAYLLTENIELRSRLNLNSKNSHKPPSSDGLTKKPGLPKDKNKKSGGQLGHKGKTLKMVEVPDFVVVHHAPSCPCCMKAFSASDVDSILQKRQVFDIPAPRMEVTEHQQGVIICCGREHVAAFPSQVGQPVQYGSRIKALSVLLNNDYKLPLKKIEQLTGDLWGCSFNESTVLAANASMYTSLKPVEEKIQSSILASEVAHFDETGMRVEKKLHWFHNASTNLFTHLFVHTKRGKEALDSESSIIKDFKNWAIHDCWGSYFDYSQCFHALCGAHLLRELTNLIENGSKWAAQMHEYFLNLYHASQKASQVVSDKKTWEEQFNTICQLAQTEEPAAQQGKRGKPKNTKGRNLLNRLVKNKDGWLAFAFVEQIPFTNNQAERDIRCLKTKQKVATNFQTFKGAEHFARIQSFVSTLRKHNMNAFQNLIKVFDNTETVFQYA
jgi:transposase